MHLVALGLTLENLVVKDTARGGPCWNVLQVGDIISHIDGASLEGKNRRSLKRISSGEFGSKVTIQFLREGLSLMAEVRRNVSKISDESDSLKQRIDNQVRTGERSLNKDELKNVFDKYSNGNSYMSIQILHEAIKEFDLDSPHTGINAEHRDLVLKQCDLSQNGMIDFPGFSKIVQASTSLDQWFRGMNVDRLLSFAVPRRPGEDPLESASKLDPESIDILVSVVSKTLKEWMWREVCRLREGMKMSTAHVEDIGLKFQTDTPKMVCGSIDSFYKGVTGRIGSPFSNFEDAMKAEHCDRPTSTNEFFTKNRKITTTTRREWEIVTTPACRPELDKSKSRRIPDIGELLELESSKKAGLGKVEFMIYNCILRHFPRKLYLEFKSAKNLFPTTIFVLVSALQKLSRVCRVPPGMRLYRGISDEVDLPELFFKVDENGCSGFTEWSFMSATENMEVALTYARQGKRLGRLLVIEPGSIDRGACIDEFSQYPHEKEHVFVPCSFVAYAGTQLVEFPEKFGVVNLISVRVNCNLRNRTVEEQLRLTKDLHIDLFTQQLEDIKIQLHKIASKEGRASNRISKDRSAGEQHNVDDFLDRIVQQCTEVLNRHRAVEENHFLDFQVYRNLMLEMIDVKVMAIAKLKEWLKSESFIRSRWNIPLRDAYRNWLSFLNQKRLSHDAVPDRQRLALKLCKTMGAIVKSVDEVNELGETLLMVAAAEGKDSALLELLVEAGADVNRRQASGVSALWMAAQHGQVSCVRTLIRLKGQPLLPANDGVTPLHVAARNGHIEVARTLIDLNADVDTKDVFKRQPVHEAALHGHKMIIELLESRGASMNNRDCRGLLPSALAEMAGKEDCAKVLTKSSTSKRKRLIISTGDISDVDGFFALAEYAKSGADVLFIMNYPAYIGVSESDVQKDFAEKNPGLGYRYSAKEIVSRDHQGDECAPFQSILGYYDAVADINMRMKHAMTDLAFNMLRKVWAQCVQHQAGGHRRKFMFAIGGINSVNPFSESAVKNEVLVYASCVDFDVRIAPEQGLVYNTNGEVCLVEWDEYSHIYMDFNGSMSFWNGHLAQQLSSEKVVSKIQGVFIMGGVLADKPSQTMPPIPNVLNRFSSATMNQLYHPQKAADFFAFLAQFNIPTWVVSNNVVQSIVPKDPSQGATSDDVAQFLDSNDLKAPFLRELAQLHYESKYNPPRKPYDYYCAVSLHNLLQLQSKGPNPRWVDVTEASRDRQYLFYSNVYGMALISASDTWEEARAAYCAQIESLMAEIKPEDSDFLQNKKRLFGHELGFMRQMVGMSCIPVQTLSFRVEDTFKIRLVTAVPRRGFGDRASGAS